MFGKEVWWIRNVRTVGETVTLREMAMANVQLEEVCRRPAWTYTNFLFRSLGARSSHPLHYPPESTAWKLLLIDRAANDGRDRCDGSHASLGTW